MNITFQPVRLTQAPLQFRWRQTPHVARWWNIAPYDSGLYLLQNRNDVATVVSNQ